jgi:hypothetical protein
MSAGEQNLLAVSGHFHVRPWAVFHVRPQKDVSFASAEMGSPETGSETILSCLRC